jgi:hypothetical protein
MEGVKIKNIRADPVPRALNTAVRYLSPDFSGHHLPLDITNLI